MRILRTLTRRKRNGIGSVSRRTWLIIEVDGLMVGTALTPRSWVYERSRVSATQVAVVASDVHE